MTDSTRRLAEDITAKYFEAAGLPQSSAVFDRAWHDLERDRFAEDVFSIPYGRTESAFSAEILTGWIAAAVVSYVATEVLDAGKRRLSLRRSFNPRTFRHRLVARYGVSPQLADEVLHFACAELVASGATTLSLQRYLGDRRELG